MRHRYWPEEDVDDRDKEDLWHDDDDEQTRERWNQQNKRKNKQKNKQAKEQKRSKEANKHTTARQQKMKLKRRTHNAAKSLTSKSGLRVVFRKACSPLQALKPDLHPPIVRVESQGVNQV